MGSGIYRPIIFGASGYLGRHFIKALGPAARAVAIVSNDSISFENNVAIRVHPDISAAIPSLDGLAATENVVFHLAGLSRERIDRNIWDTNVRGTENIVEWSKNNNVKRIIFMSGYGVREDSQSVYYKSKARAEKIVISSGMDYVIFRCSYIIGGNDELIPALIEDAKRGVVPLPGSGEWLIQPVFIGDIIKLFAYCASRDAQCEGIHNILGEVISLRQLYVRILHGLKQEVTFSAVPLEQLIRAAVLERGARFSLSQLGILCANLTGPVTQDVLGIRLTHLDGVINLAVDLAQ